ncbi:MAG: DNA internalization-related competence protein ComEC/Rec2, partial [Lachnospiraceae bacterium]|nr:DNA internalization-related competence protein ComEC/Rec2 [Lachnospiraceae bacterium]
GLHISILGAGLFFLLRRFVMPMRPAAVCTGILLLLYGELTGFSVSARRAVIMMLCLLVAHFFNRRYDLLSALSLAALIQLWFQPLVLFQAGFLLSYGTVLGIALFLPFFAEAGPRKNFLWGMAGDSLGIFLVNLPVLLYFYYELSLYSTLVNALVLPFMGFLLLMSLVGSGLSLVSMMTGRFLFGVVHTILRYYTFITELARQLPFAILITGPPELWQIFFYYILLFVWRWLLEKKEEKERHEKFGKTGKKVWLLILACALLLFRPPVPKQLQITSLDVGQGDCTLIRTEAVTILVDGGSSDVGKVGKYRISKFLKHEGIRKLDMIFFTHSDSDHTNGLLELIQEKRHMNFSIGEIILPDIKKQEENYRELEKICLQSGIPLHKIKKGDVIQAGDLRINCLHPYYEYDWQSENDYSLVLQLDYKGFRGLLTGDLEQSGEEAVLEEIENVDYLKVGHHGSKGSSSEDFLKKARPEISVISAGENNRYGHPAKE